MTAAVLIAAVLAAGAIGAVIRYLVTRALGGWGVLVVNVLGSALSGGLLALTGGDLRLVLLTGFCGGLTTFSTFSVETVQAVLDGKVALAARSVALNLVLGVGAAALVYLIAR